VLQTVDFIKSYGASERGEPEENRSVAILGLAEPAGEGAFQVSYASDEGATAGFAAEESWTLRGAAGEQPLFVDDDSFVVSHEPMPQKFHDLLFALLNGYHSLEFYDDYRDRPEFKLGVHSFSRFRADFAWYRANPGAIRLRNKWVDEIGMAEEMLRARAYAPTLAQKAELFDAEMPLFLNPLSMISQARIGSDPLEQSESGDGLLWNGGYLASQVFRYLETGEQQALDNWLAVLDAQFLCQDIVQDPTTFARSVRPHVGGGKDWIRGASPYEAYDWLEPGNNDMIKGLFYGYVLSWLYLPDEPEYDDYRAGIAQRAALIAQYNGIALDNGMNEIYANLLAYMTTGEQRFWDRYQEVFVDYYDLWIGIGDGMFYLWGVSDWSGQHLNTVSQLAFWFMAQAADQQTAELMKEGWINGMRMSAPTRQVLWPIAAFAFADPPEDLRWVLEESIWSLRELPYPKQNFAIDHRVDPQWCASPLPCLFWKLDWMEGGRHQGLTSPPLFQRNVSTNYFVAWPFSYEGTESDWTDSGGPDFLHAYWMARYYDIIGPED